MMQNGYTIFTLRKGYAVYDYWGAMCKFHRVFSMFIYYFVEHFCRIMFFSVRPCLGHTIILCKHLQCHKFIIFVNCIPLNSICHFKNQYYYYLFTLSFNSSFLNTTYTLEQKSHFKKALYLLAPENSLQIIFMCNI